MFVCIVMFFCHRSIVFFFIQGAGKNGSKQEMKRPPELFDLFMTYSFKNLDQKVAAGNVIVNYTSRKKCTKKRKSAESTTKLKAKKDESQDERVKKFKGAEGKEPVSDNEDPLSEDSSF